jgi:hypothetical protein
MSSASFAAPAGRSLLALTASALLLLGGTAPAEAVSYGNLSRADGSPIIVDSLNGREWLGWDVTRGLAYAQTIAATEAGGQFEGYQLARVADGFLFMDAMYGAPNSCPAGTFCPSVSPAFTPVWNALVGESGSAPQTFGGEVEYDFDYVAVLADDPDRQVALLGHANFSSPLANYMYLNTTGTGTIAQFDEVSATASSYGWLLYRAAGRADVPLPGTLGLMSIGLLGAGVVVRRRREVRRS